jgi:hypothetical protein
MSQNLAVGIVLVSFPDGGVSLGRRTGRGWSPMTLRAVGVFCVRDGDPYHPVKSWLDAGRSVVGLLLVAQADRGFASLPSVTGRMLAGRLLTSGKPRRKLHQACMHLACASICERFLRD